MISGEIGDRVYVVVWPHARIVKAGYTGRLRWRGFVNRGAVLHQLTRHDSLTAAFAYEGQLHAVLDKLAPRAFADRIEAEPFLGAGGGGWLEAYRLPDLAMLQALPAPPPEQCLEEPDRYDREQCPIDFQAMHVRTDERTYADGETGDESSTNASRAGGQAKP